MTWQILGNVSVSDDLEFLLKQPWHSETTLQQVLNWVIVSCCQLMLAFNCKKGLVSKETVVLYQVGDMKHNFAINQVDKSQIEN